MAAARCPKCGRAGTYSAKWGSCSACADEAKLSPSVFRSVRHRDGTRSAIVGNVVVTGSARPVRERMSDKPAPKRATKATAKRVTTKASKTRKPRASR